ncbi:ABC transporter permease [Reyranella sp.]|uniref:ABC transporter permease n=1 Tax=Reyranella sp. TaxID=1929291 RepID=UPI003C7D62C6
MKRDLMMRYGRDNIGFAWAILEPMILTCGVMIIWSVSGPSRNGIKVVEIVLTGYMPLTLWRHLTGPVVNMFRSSSALLYHRRVTLFDLVTARQALEFIATTTALFVVWSVLNIAGLVGDIARWDLFLLGWFMMAAIGAAFGAMLAAVTELTETIERFVQPFQYLNIPISGAFFMVDWLPSWGQQVALYHPLVHCYEVFRAGFFGDALVTHYDLAYFAQCAFVVAFVGILSVAGVRKRVRLN